MKSGRSQQYELPLGTTYQIPEDEPVRLLWEVLEGMDFTEQEKQHAKSPWSVQELFAIWIFGEMNGLYSTRKVEDASKYDIRFKWLLDGKRAPDHNTLNRFRKEVMPALLQDMFRQLMSYLYEQGELDYETVFIDGTKIEANANRYSFVWRKKVENYLAKLREKAGQALLEMDITEPAGIPLLRQTALLQREAMHEAGIESTSGKGRHKSSLQKSAEAMAAMADRWAWYERQLEIMGPDRNSYAKTDTDATFMRMKDDHMGNGQLKAGYNVQLAVNSEYIVGYGIFADRNDSGTLISMLDTLYALHGRKYTSVTADAGYEAHENYKHLEEHEQLSFIKPTDYEKRKKKSSWVGRFEDMAYDETTDSFTCQKGKTLSRTGERTRKSKTGFESKAAVYTCTECVDCPLRDRCSRSKDEMKKTLEVCWDFIRLREASRANITSEAGILYRMNRSIQNEGAFGVVKEDWDFRRFLTRGNNNVLTEIGMLSFAFDIKKYHKKLAQNRARSHLFPPKPA